MSSIPSTKLATPSGQGKLTLRQRLRGNGARRLNRTRSLTLAVLAAASGLAGMTSCRAQNGAYRPAHISETSPLQFHIDTTQNRTPISPFIYGTNQGDILPVTKGLTLIRLGGNLMTPFNWENNATNAGTDYFNLNTDMLGGGDVPGAVVKGNIELAFSHNASIIVTVPMLGYATADKKNDGDIVKTPDYLHTRFIESRARKGKPFAFPPDTTDKVVYQDEMVAFVERTFPNAHKNTANTIFYCLDNEPDLWNHTHVRLHPKPVTYAELIGRSVEYGAAIKAAAPDALVFGPVSYGWQGFVNLQNAPDANGRNFLDVYLDQMKQAEQAQGKRLVDVLDIHWYPENSGGAQRITASGGAPPELAAARVQAPRSLWDPTFREDTWIANNLNGPIRLLPRLKEQIARHYPGTKLAMTEYCYGGTDDISGAVAQADVLGIFGREGVFAANWFKFTGNGSFTYGAFSSYRNYDGKGAHVGDVGVKADTNDIERSSIYANVDSADPKKMFLVALNKTTNSLPATITLTSPQAFSSADVYQLTGKSMFVQPAGKVSIADKRLVTTLPPMSVSTFVLHP